MEPKSPSKRKIAINGLKQYKRAITVGAVILAVLLVMLVGFYFTFRSSEDSDRVIKGSYFTVVLDCGSSGTRVNVYEWGLRGKSKRALPVLLHSYPDNSTKSSLSKNSCKYHCLQTEPGLDKFVGNSSGVRDSLEPLIAWAEQIVPLERHSGTPVFVLATAGLRRLAKEDRVRVLEDVVAVVKEHSFSYKRSWIRVLSGKEEAYYGWVALNYKMGIFRNHSTLPTLGLLDLGGSSLQVVTEVDSVHEDTHLVRSKFGFIEHRILAYSLPAFGLNEAFDRTVVLLSHTEALRESGGHTLELRHPCFGSDFVENYTCYGCFGLYFGKQKNVSRGKENESLSLLLVGVPHWEQCKMLARMAAINSSSLESPLSTAGADFESSLCSNGGGAVLNLTANPHPTPRFHALSGFFAVYDRLNLNPKANLTKIWERGQHRCSRTWADKNNDSKNQRYSEYDCFRVPYMTSLIENALCLGDKEIFFGPADVSWTLGAVMVEGEYLWLSNATSQVTDLNLYKKPISSPITVFFLLVCLLSIVYFCQIKLPMVRRKNFSTRESSNFNVYPRRRPN